MQVLLDHALPKCSLVVAAVPSFNGNRQQGNNYISAYLYSALDFC